MSPVNPTAILVRGYGPASRVNNMIHPRAMLLECRHFNIREAGITPWSHVEAREAVRLLRARSTHHPQRPGRVPETPARNTFAYSFPVRHETPGLRCLGWPTMCHWPRATCTIAGSNYVYRYSHTKVCSRFGELAGRHRNHTIVHRPSPGSLVPFHGCYGLTSDIVARGFIYSSLPRRARRSVRWTERTQLQLHQPGRPGE